MMRGSKERKQEWCDHKEIDISGWEAGKRNDGELEREERRWGKGEGLQPLCSVYFAVTYPDLISEGGLAHASMRRLCRQSVH